tara:strand:- start:29 stop:1015 length:987 start_codon:yes stop_codon:yes gene_type:complete
MKIYTPIEAAAKTSIPKRTIQYKCKRDNIRKKLNVYQITDEVLKKWIEEDANNPRNTRAIAQDVEPGTNSTLEYKQAFFLATIDKYEEEAAEALSFREWSKETIKDLKIKASLKASKHKERCDELEEAVRGYISYIEKYEVEIKELKYQLEDFDPEAELEDYLPEIEGVPLEQIEAFEFQFKRSGEDEEKKGNLLFIQKGMVSIEYTPEEFNNVKLNLENYKLLELKIKHLDELHAANLEKAAQAEKNKDKLHDSEVKNKDEVHALELLKSKESETHYKNIYYYMRQQNSKFTRMHEKFMESVMLSGKENMIKTVKDAKNTDWKKSNS